MRRRWLVASGLLLAAACAAAAAAVLVLRSEWFKEQVRLRIVREVENASGGTALLESFDFDWKNLAASAGGFTLRGKEPRDGPPLFHASRLTLRLSVLSWLGPEIRLQSFSVERPRLFVIVFPDGSTNLPQPRVQAPDTDALESLMRLKIGRIELLEGHLEFDGRGMDFRFAAEGLDLKLLFQPGEKRYRVESSVERLDLPAGYRPAMELAGWLETKGFVAEKAVVRLGESRIQAAGQVQFSPLEAGMTYEARLSANDFRQAKLRRGAANVSGRFAWAGGQWEASGQVEAANLAFVAGGIEVSPASFRSGFEWKQDSLELRGVRFSTPFGRGAGEARLTQGRDLQVSADLAGIDLDRCQRALLEDPYDWSGSAAGHVRAKAVLSSSGVSIEEAAAAIEIEPGEGQAPLSGTVTASWNKREGALRLDGTSLATPQARLNVEGVLGRQLHASLRTRSIRELESIARVALRDPAFTLPVRLDNGSASVDAKITGEIESPAVSGRVELRNARVDEVPFDAFEAVFEASAREFRATSLKLRQNGATLSGRLSAGLEGWKASWSSPVDVSLRLERAAIEPTLGLFRIRSPLKGILDGSIEAKGPAGAPALAIVATGSSLALGQESVRKATLKLKTVANGDFEGHISLDAATARLSGRLRHAEGDFTNGSAAVTISTNNVRLGEIESLQAAGPRVAGLASASLTAEASFSPTGVRWTALDGMITSPEIMLNDRRLEGVELRSETKSGDIRLTVRFSMQGESSKPFELGAKLDLNAGPLLAGSFRLPETSLAFLRDSTRAGAQTDSEPLPVRGRIEGTGGFSVRLNDPRSFQADLAIERFQLRPRQDQVLDAQVDASGLTLSNNGPLLIGIENERAMIRSASLTAKETRLTLSGSAGLGGNAALNLRMAGEINLGVLTIFHSDLDARGRAELDATIRGTAADPSLSGRMSIRGASFYLKDVTNGIENANGTFFFERNRANIEKLTGQTGGGEFQISGFVGLNEGDLNYRLSARGKAIRIRYPEGVSTTADAALELVGSPARSLLSGTITVLRSGFVAGDDFGEMMGSAARPIATPAARNEFLRNLQFDVKVRTAPDATLVSSYTEGLQTEANLQIRGSPSKPIVLGNIQVNQGDIRFFGNRYTISRGEMLFYNTAVIQPEIDLDLETRIRGVTVYIKVSGPLTRLNVNYRSEPPLQSNEILALLTVGRAPSASEGNLQANTSIRSTNVLENTSSNSLLGGALSAGISSRVERFFGASRIKIDPQATGVDNVAQARLSIEQSLSRDVTVTFITNLSRTQEQIVRVEWDLSRQWQVIAVRDERGVFAVDFIFRKRFK